MDLGANVMGDQTQDTLRIGSRDDDACCLKATGKAVDPESSIRIEHHLDDAGIFEISGNCRTKCRAQHPGTAEERFGLEWLAVHFGPLKLAAMRGFNRVE